MQVPGETMVVMVAMEADGMGLCLPDRQACREDVEEEAVPAVTALMIAGFAAPHAVM